MEMYLLLAFVLLYVLMTFFVRERVMHKIWTLAFITAFVITAAAIAFLRVNNQDVMMNANELNWYYLLYLFGSLAVVFGVINLWMYRRALFHIFFGDNDDDDDAAD